MQPRRATTKGNDMISWYYGVLLGGTTLAVMNSVKKTIPITLSNFICLFPLLVLVQLGFWFAFYYGGKQGASLVTVWFTGSALSALSAICLGLFWFNEPFTPRIVMGILLVLIGQHCLRG